MSTMSSTEPWPKKADEVKRLAIAMTVICTVSTLWRLVLRFRVSPRMGWSDWLMLAGTAMSFVCNVPYIITAANAGLGRLEADPFFTPARIQVFHHLEFISICLQMYAMFLVKFSVCCYLLGLDFSRRFRAITWMVTLMVVTFNLVMPLLLHFGYCRPFYYRWHPEVVPECWPHTVGSVAEYAQILSNIATDLVYASAPIVYLSQVNLKKQTRWAVRFMFLLALVGTGASIGKLITMHRWLHSNEPYYDIAAFYIWSTNEISICIIVANLPIQRKSIRHALAAVLPEHFHTFLGLAKETEYTHTQVYASTFDLARQRGTDAPTADDGSEMAIMELGNGRIVMAPKKVATRDRGSRGTLATFWNNESKDSIS